MNRSLSLIRIIACWEFHRYFKLKDQVIGLVSMLLGGVVMFTAARIAQSSDAVEIAVIGASTSFSIPENGDISVSKEQLSEQEWQKKVASKDIDGLLVIRSGADSNALPDSEAVPGNGQKNQWTARLYVHRDPAWLDQLMPSIQAERTRWEMEQEGLSAETLARVMAPVVVDVVTNVESGVSKADTLAAYAFLGATLMTSWIALAWILTGITGEKHQRVTEQIVSAVRPQVWIDGKLLGITAAAVCSLAFLFVSGIVALIFLALTAEKLPLPGSLQRLEFLPLFVVFYLGGILFWNYFYAANAAIINDPNTSSRSSLLFIPMFPMFACALATNQPDGPFMKFLSLLPGSSVTAMPIRLVMGEVSPVEVLISILLLAAGILLLRLAAGRIFAAGVLLQGKEPSWTDIIRSALGNNRESPFSQ